MNYSLRELNLGDIKEIDALFSIVFQHDSKTLEDKDVSPVIDDIISGAEREFNAKLRT